jgi:hypothetical protein
VLVLRQQNAETDDQHSGGVGDPVRHACGCDGILRSVWRPDQRQDIGAMDDRFRRDRDRHAARLTA